MKNTGRNKAALIAFEAREAAAKLLDQRFGRMSSEDTPPIDAVIMRRLNDALVMADEQLLEACFLRGLLPAKIGEALRMAAFLSYTLPMARAAQAETGVPCSLLIAEAYQISNVYFHVDHFYLKQPSSHDLFATGKTYASFKEAFIEHAHEIRATKVLEPALCAAALRNTKQYLEQLQKWSSKKYGNDLVATIEQHSLFECDRLKSTCFE